MFKMAQKASRQNSTCRYIQNHFHAFIKKCAILAKSYPNPVDYQRQSQATLTKVSEAGFNKMILTD